MNLIQKNLLLLSSTLILSLFSLWIFSNTGYAMQTIEEISLFVREYFGTFYLVLGLSCVLFMILLAFSPFGKTRLGSSQPEHSLWSWIAMLYSAGMGAGILLRAVQEPVYMQQNPPFESTLSHETLALEYTFYQWGFTPWAMYGIFALIIGYYLYNRNQSVLMSSVIKSSFDKPFLNNSIDILTILTTVFGVVAAIALGTTQINGGVNHLFNSELGINFIFLIIVLISIISLTSALLGVNKGIKLISKLNILITLFLLAFVFFQSDVLTIIQQFGLSLYHYIIDFIPMSLAIEPYNPGKEFLTGWTYYYWAFWLAWAPFTGIFIARISKGRTVRQFILGILLIPSLGTFLWFTTFGVSAFALIENWGRYHNEFGNVFTSIFIFFKAYPIQGFINTITVILLITFLITSIDSAIFVLSMFTDRGNQTPSKKHRIIWGIIIPIVACSLVLLGNIFPEINVLDAMSKLLIITSLPFAILTVVMVALFVLY